MCLSFPSLPRGEIQSSPLQDRVVVQLLVLPLRFRYTRDLSRNCSWFLSSRTVDAGHRIVRNQRTRQSQPVDSNLLNHLLISPLIEETSHSLTISTFTSLSQESAPSQTRPVISRYQHKRAVASHCSDVFRLSPFPANVASQVSTCRWNEQASTAAEARVDCWHE